MILDDEPDIVSTIKRELHHVGFTNVQAFINPLTALADFLLSPDSYSLVLSDIMMPGMTGYEFVTRIKRANPDVKALLMATSDIHESKITNLMPSIKVDEIIKKPLPIPELLDTIARHVPIDTLRTGDNPILD